MQPPEFPDGLDFLREVIRRKSNQGIERLKKAVIDHPGPDIPLTAVHYTMSDGFYAPSLRAVIKPLEKKAQCGVVIRNIRMPFE